MLTFETDIEFFREQVSRHILKLDFKPRSEKFFGSVKPIMDCQGVARVVRWTHSPGALSRDSELVRDNDETLALILIQQGSPVIQHSGHEESLAPGKMTLLRNWEPGEIASNGAVSCIGVMLQKDTLFAARTIPERLIAQRWQNSEASQLLKAYLFCLAKLDRLTDSDITLAAANHISELVRAAAKASAAPVTQERDEFWRTRLSVAIATLSQRFREPSLREREVAAEQNISSRYLQKIFERGGLRFVDELNRARLETVHRELTDVKFDKYTILQLAMNAGYNDVSYFNRLFARRFGMPPSHVRKNAAECRGS